MSPSFGIRQLPKAHRNRTSFSRAHNDTVENVHHRNEEQKHSESFSEAVERVFVQHEQNEGIWKPNDEKQRRKRYSTA